MTLRLLLDTHVLFWWLADDRKLKAKVRAILAEPENLVFVSAASLWELRIKEGLGKVDLPTDFEETLDAQSFEQLSVTAAHAHALRGLPLHQRHDGRRIHAAGALQNVSRSAIILDFAKVSRRKGVVANFAPVAWCATGLVPAEVIR